MAAHQVNGRVTAIWASPNVIFLRRADICALTRIPHHIFTGRVFRACLGAVEPALWRSRLNSIPSNIKVEINPKCRTMRLHQLTPLVADGAL